MHERRQKTPLCTPLGGDNVRESKGEGCHIKGEKDRGEEVGGGVLESPHRIRNS